MYQVSIKKIKILGVEIDNLSFDQALIQVDRLIEQGRKGNPKFIVKPNTEIVTYAQKDPEFKKILNSADLAPPDGVGLIIGSRILKMQGRALQAIQERVGGPDLTEAILQLAEKKDYSCYFYGAKPKVIEKLASVLKKRFPKLKISGSHPGYFENDQVVIENIKKFKPDILFVALGFPKQEKWIVRHLSKLQVPISVVEGGSFDFISGEVRRAPKWMRRVGLEWLFRLILQPHRIRRQLSLPKFLILVLLNK